MGFSFFLSFPLRCLEVFVECLMNVKTTFLKPDRYTMLWWLCPAPRVLGRLTFVDVPNTATHKFTAADRTFAMLECQRGSFYSTSPPWHSGIASLSSSVASLKLPTSAFGAKPTSRFEAVLFSGPS